MMASEPESRDLYACLAKLSKWDGHVTPWQWSSGGRYE
jgi:hypothetical protein